MIKYDPLHRVLKVTITDEFSNIDLQPLLSDRLSAVVIDLTNLTTISYEKSSTIKLLIEQLFNKGMKQFCFVTRPSALSLIREFLRLVGVKDAAFFTDIYAANRYLSLREE